MRKRPDRPEHEKQQLVDAWAQVCPGISKAQLKAALQVLCEHMAQRLLSGCDVALPQVGKLKLKTRAARVGRNPRTGEAIALPAGRRIVFVPCKAVREQLNEEARA